MKQSIFFAMLSRMKYINRWGLMRNSRQENLSEHTLDVCYITHALCSLSGVDPARPLLCALYHDCSEIITGDLPTPIKYASEDIRKSYKALESDAGERLLSTLPETLAAQYRLCFFESDAQTLRLVKAADRLSALIKCIEEIRMGNHDFLSAREAQIAALHEMRMDCVEEFIDRFLPAYEMTLDEMSR